MVIGASHTRLPTPYKVSMSKQVVELTGPKPTADKEKQAFKHRASDKPHCSFCLLNQLQDHCLRMWADMRRNSVKVQYLPYALHFYVSMAPEDSGIGFAFRLFFKT